MPEGIHRQEPAVLTLEEPEAVPAWLSDVLQGDTFYFRKENILRDTSNSECCSCHYTADVTGCGCVTDEVKGNMIHKKTGFLWSPRPSA